MPVLSTRCVKLFNLRKGFRQGDRLEHRFRLVDGFLKFRFGGRVVDPAAAGLHVGFAVLEQRRADGDARVQIAIEAEVAHASGIRPAGNVARIRS